MNGKIIYMIFVIAHVISAIGGFVFAILLLLAGIDSIKDMIKNRKLYSCWRVKRNKGV